MRSRSRQSEAAAIAPARTLPVRRRRFAAGRPSPYHVCAHKLRDPRVIRCTRNGPICNRKRGSTPTLL